MPAKRIGCVGNVLAGLFTTVMAPVLVNVLTQEVANRPSPWNAAAAPNPPAASDDWSRPAASAVARPPERPLSRRLEEWRRAFEARAR